MMGESGESEIEDDDEDLSSDDGAKKSKKKKSRDVDNKDSSGGVYKAPKLNAVAYEDSKDRKKRLKEEY